MSERSTVAQAIARGDWAKAEHNLLRWMDQNPTDFATVASYAAREFDKGHYGLARHLYKYLLHFWQEMTPEYRTAVWSQMAASFRVEGFEAEAQYCFDEALKTGANPAAVYAGMAIGYIGQAQPEKVIELCSKAIALDPSLDDVRWNRSTGYLETRRWKEGWADYSFGDRKRQKSYHQDKKTQEWDGKRNRNVVVWGEQGVGDEIMFGSCLPDLLKAVSGEVILDCHPRLEKTWRRSFPGIPIYPTRKTGKIYWHYQHEIDKQVSIASLPRFFRNHDRDFPGTPFLKADPERVAHYRAKLAELGPGPYVAIAWFGGEKKTRNDYRSIPLKLWDPIRAAGGTFVSIQYNKWGHRKEALENNIPEWSGYYAPTGPIEDLDEMFALIEACGLVISVCQTAIHMAGAIGKECWCLVPSKPSWRYLLQGEEMPWYKSVRLIRQGADEPWESVIARAAGQYQAWKAAHQIQEHPHPQAGGQGRLGGMAEASPQAVA